ncbi:MAG: hypothetical protein NXH97_12600 [Rhodobacteraceae bacterium]|nr:hypothetical protein [Paracoccaceae bacterium]
MGGDKLEIDPVAIRGVFASDRTNIVPIGLFVKCGPYRMLGLIELGRKLVGPLDTGQPLYLLGADGLGRNMLSRILYGTRVPMTIALVGVAVLPGLGVLLGGISADNGGSLDDAVYRLVELLKRSQPCRSGWVWLPPSRRHGRRGRYTSLSPS